MKVFFIAGAAVYIVVFVVWILFANQEQNRKASYVLGAILMGAATVSIVLSFCAVKQQKTNIETVSDDGLHVDMMEKTTEDNMDGGQDNIWVVPLEEDTGLDSQTNTMDDIQEDENQSVQEPYTEDEKDSGILEDTDGADDKEDAAVDSDDSAPSIENSEYVE